MTTVIFHGLLAKKFGDRVKLHIGNLNSLFVAIDAIKIGFLNFIKEKQKQNQFYSYCVQGESKEIYIFPSLIGAGANFGIILGFLIGGFIGGAIIWATGLYKSPIFWKVIGIIFQVAGMIVNFFMPGLGFVLQAIGSGIQTYGNILEAEKKAQKMKISRQIHAGGQAMGIEARGKSYNFNSSVNLQGQGKLVALGYGKMKVGSSLISISMKSFNPNLTFEDEVFKGDQNVQIYG
jgi:predicted phage tail protein